MNDLAGNVPTNHNRLQSWARVHGVANNFLTRELMEERYQDLSTQYDDPHTRQWERIEWNKVSPDEILDVKKETFLSFLRAAAEVEAPVPQYGTESWGYLRDIEPEFSLFVSGERTPEGERIRDGKGRGKGVWEEEEWGHSAHFRKIYNQLSGEKLSACKEKSVDPVERGDDPREAAKRHLQMRIAAEVSAVAGYSWLMSHSTGELQKAIAQPFQDEVGHLSKFWGFYREAFPEENTASTLAGVTRSLVGMGVKNSRELSSSSSLQDDRIGMGLAFGQVLASAVHWDATRKA